jgi:hypothetical protein
MTHLGFGIKWRDSISSLWATASSTDLLNGHLGKKILHCRGVMQWGPLSPMLFLLAIEPLHPGRELLMKAVLSSMPTHFLSVFKLPQ